MTKIVPTDPSVLNSNIEQNTKAKKATSLRKVKFLRKLKGY